MSVLRELLKRGSLIAAPGAYDPYSARLIEDLGFPAVYLGGNAVGLHLCKGQPFVTSTEQAEVTARVRSAVDIPIIVDAGAGFGDAAHAYRAVLDLQQAGAAALHIDDQVYPKRAHYHRGKVELAPVEAVVAKLRAAVAARRDRELLVIARTDALRATGSFEAVLERGRAYAGAGVDALLVLDLQGDDAARVAQACPGLPLVWIGGVREQAPALAELEAAGFAMALYPFQSIAAVTEALHETWSALAREGRPRPTRRPGRELLDLALRLVRMETYWKIEAP